MLSTIKPIQILDERAFRLLAQARKVQVDTLEQARRFDHSLRADGMGARHNDLLTWYGQFQLQHGRTLTVDDFRPRAADGALCPR